MAMNVRRSAQVGALPNEKVSILRTTGDEKKVLFLYTPTPDLINLLPQRHLKLLREPRSHFRTGGEMFNRKDIDVPGSGDEHKGAVGGNRQQRQLPRRTNVICNNSSGPDALLHSERAKWHMSHD
eukprot:GILI01047174.1.p2 GENE.GILI01047174.1~~GILI01047174.1.p2  ORF type:complete len:125 (-),score=8.62 GILI01047174.1:31-405(-)